MKPPTDDPLGATAQAAGYDDGGRWRGHVVETCTDEAAAGMFARVLRAHDAITLLQDTEHLRAWHDTLRQLADREGLHGPLAGRAVLLHGDAMWDVLDDWLPSPPPDTFTAVLPLPRRTFSTFEPPERRQMGERATRGPARPAARAMAAAGSGTAPADFDAARVEAVLPLPCQSLGLDAANWS